MPDASATLEILLQAKDEASQALQGIGGKVKSVFNSIPVPVAAAGAAGVAAIGGLAAAALKFGGDFDAAFDTIRVGTGATGDNLKALQGDFKSVFAGIPTDMESASQAVADLNTRLGLTGPPLQQLSKQFIELSRITDTDLGTNIETVTRAFGDWGVATENQSATLDKLFRVSQATGPSVDELSRLIVQFGAPMRQFGFTMEESAALLARFQKEGVNTELVMGSLRIAGGKFAKDGVPLREGLEDTIKKIQELGPSAEATALAMEIFGARAGVDMVDTILGGKFAIEDLMATLEGSQDTILGVSRETADMGEQWTLLKNNVLVLLEPLLTRIFGLFGEGVEVLKNVVQYLTFTAEEGDHLNDSLADLPGVIKPIVQGFGELIVFLKEGDTAFENSLVKQSSFGMMLIDVARIVIEVVGVIRENWTTISDVFNFVFEYVKTRIEGTIQVISSVIEIVTSVVNLVSALFHGDWSRAWEEMKDIAVATVDLLIGTLKAQFGNIPFLVIDLAEELAREGLRAGQRLADSIIDGIGDLAGRVADELSIAGVSLGDVAGVIGGGLGKIGLRASGGPASGLTWVGERGPELLNLPPGSYVHSNAESRRMVESRTPATIYIGSIALPGVANAREFLDELQRLQSRELQLAGRGV